MKGLAGSNLSTECQHIRPHPAKIQEEKERNKRGSCETGLVLGLRYDIRHIDVILENEAIRLYLYCTPGHLARVTMAA